MWAKTGQRLFMFFPKTKKKLSTVGKYCVCGDLGRLKSTTLLYAGGAEVKNFKLWKTFDFKYHLSSRAAPLAALSSPE